jgi:hypothetical protein
MRELDKEMRTKNVIDPESNYALLTKEQIATCEYMESKVVLNYESGFGSWEQNRWNFWGDILFQGVPVATALEMYKPLLQKEIKDTLEAVFVEVKQFKPVPAETFESGDLTKFLITTNGLPESSAKVKASLATGDKSLDGTTSISFNYPATEDWAIIARTDETKIELPSYHRYVIKFDYQVTSDGPMNLYLTIRPKAGIATDEVSYGFVKVACEPGKKTKFEGNIDVLAGSKDNVLVIIGENKAAQIVIDNFQITEG